MNHTDTDTNNQLKNAKIVNRTFVLGTEAATRVAFLKKGFLENLAKVMEKTLRQNLIFNKVAGLRPATLLKNRLWSVWHNCFPVNFVKFLRTPF